MLITLKRQSFFALQSNPELNYLCNWWWIPPVHFSVLLVLWLSFHSFIFFPMLLDNYIAPAQYKRSFTSSGSIDGLFKVSSPFVFWGMSIPQCSWVSLQHSWKFSGIILLKSIAKVFISLPSSCLVSEQAGAGLGWHPPFPSTPGCAQADPWLSMASDSACAMSRFCNNSPGTLSSFLAACACSCLSKWFHCMWWAAAPFPPVWYCCLSVVEIKLSLCTWQGF